MSSITLPIHRAGRPGVDLGDLWRQLATTEQPTPRYRPHPLPAYFQVLVNDQPR